VAIERTYRYTCGLPRSARVLRSATDDLLTDLLVRCLQASDPSFQIFDLGSERSDAFQHLDEDDVVEGFRDARECERMISHVSIIHVSSRKG